MNDRVWLIVIQWVVVLCTAFTMAFLSPTPQGAYSMKTKGLRQSKNVEDMTGEKGKKSREEAKQYFKDIQSGYAEDSEHLFDKQPLSKQKNTDWDNMMNTYSSSVPEGVAKKTKNASQLIESSPAQKMKELKDGIYPRQYTRLK